jgi:hypothetical protein
MVNFVSVAGMLRTMPGSACGFTGIYNERNPHRCFPRAERLMRLVFCLKSWWAALGRVCSAGDQASSVQVKGRSVTPLTICAAWVRSTRSYGRVGMTSFSPAGFLRNGDRSERKGRRYSDRDVLP